MIHNKFGLAAAWLSDEKGSERAVKGNALKRWEMNAQIRLSLPPHIPDEGIKGSVNVYPPFWDTMRVILCYTE